MRRAPGTPRRSPSRPRASSASPACGRARPGRAAGATAFVLAASVAGLWATGGFGHGHEGGPPAGSPSRARLVAPGGLELALVSFERLADGHAGVNSPVLPMTSRGMPMAGNMGPIGDAIAKGSERVAVSVLLHNKGPRTLRYSTGAFGLTSAGEPVALLRPTQSTFSSDALPPGARLSATVYFVIPEGRWPLALSYDGSGPVPLGRTPPAATSKLGSHRH